MPISVFMTDYSPLQEEKLMLAMLTHEVVNYLFFPYFLLLKMLLLLVEKSCSSSFYQTHIPNLPKKKLRHVLHEKTNNKNRLLNSIYISNRYNCVIASFA